MSDVETIEDEPQIARESIDDEAQIDLESAAPTGTPCEACGAPIEPLDRFCTACASPNPKFAGASAEARHVDEESKTNFFRCDNCGAEVRTEEDKRSYVCPFCDSTYVAEFSQDATTRQPPEFAIGFTLTHDEALEKFRTWLADNSIFRPGDLRLAKIAEKLGPVVHFIFPTDHRARLDRLLSCYRFHRRPLRKNGNDLYQNRRSRHVSVKGAQKSFY